MLKRVVGFTYGIVCYLIFFGTFLCAIGFVGGANLYSPEQKLVAPWAIDTSSRPLGESLALRLIIDALLLSLFAVQHSVMARQWFKRRWTTVVAPLLERSTYVLIASLILLVMFWQWRPIGTSPERVAWDVHNHTARLVLAGFCWLGWRSVLTWSVLISHCDLSGVQQAYGRLKAT